MPVHHEVMKLLFLNVENINFVCFFNFYDFFKGYTNIKGTLNIYIYWIFSEHYETSSNIYIYIYIYIYITFTFSHLADAFIQSDLQMRKMEAIKINKRAMIRKCYNKSQLA